MKMTLMLVATIMLLVFAVAAQAQVTFDGKTLSFPAEHKVQAIDISALKFKLDDIPADKKFMVGVVYFYQFSHPAKGFTGASGYRLLTGWESEPETLEFFVSENSISSRKSPQHYMDCSRKGETDYQCLVRGRTTGNSWILRFRDKQMSLSASDGWEADLKPAGKIDIK